MQLRSFKVQGFKNFRQPVVLEDLGGINVIHGPNNVGKSNLLQAIELFFVLVGERDAMGVPFERVIQLDDDWLTKHGFPRAEIFNLEAPGPIVLEAEVEAGPQDLDRAGLSVGTLPLNQLRVAIELRWMGVHSVYTVLRFEATDGRDLAAAGLSRTGPELADSSAISALLSYSFRISAGANRRFARVPSDRTEDAALALALYDAKESADLEESRRWGRFVEAMDAFKDILGEGAFVAIYDRRAGRASLAYQTAHARIPMRLLGSGVQQLATVLGTLFMTGGTVVGIEEPELNLRYTLQLRLREVLTRIIGVPGGLDQLFLTSHSDAFEVGSHFYYMAPTPDGPRVEKRRVEEARAAIGLTVEGTLPDPNAVLCYLSTEGVVRVPERIRRVLGLPNGGGVVFLEHKGEVEVMSDESFADRFEPKAAEKDDEQP